QFVWLDRSCHECQTELAEGYRACSTRPADMNDGIHGRTYIGLLSGRIRMGQTSTHRPAVAGLAMSDMLERRLQKRIAARDKLAVFELSLPDGRADMQ